MGSHFRDLGVRIFWQVGILGIIKNTERFAVQK